MRRFSATSSRTRSGASSTRNGHGSSWPFRTRSHSRGVLAAMTRGVGEGVLTDAEGLERLSRSVEEAAEAAVWAELLAGRRAR